MNIDGNKLIEISKLFGSDTVNESHLKKSHLCGFFGNLQKS